MGRVSAKDIRLIEAFVEPDTILRKVEDVEITEYDGGIRVDALDATIRKLYSTLMLIKTIPETFSPEDLLRATYPNKWLREYSEGLVESYEALVADDSYEDDGEVPIRFVDYAYSSLLKVYEAVTVELTREDLVAIGCITDLTNTWYSSESVSDTNLVDGKRVEITRGFVTSVVVGTVAIGVVAGVMWGLKKRRK